MSLELKNVSKTFIDKKAVDNISFNINKPGVFALLGTNGAGKTTTIRMMLGIIKKDTGTITWNGKEVDRNNVKFGYLPEERGIYPKTRIVDQLEYLAKLKGMSKTEANKSIDYWLEKLKMTEYKYQQAEKLSKGNQQKIQFISAIMHNPELIVLDEPFSGFDPVNTELLKNIIIEIDTKSDINQLIKNQGLEIKEHTERKYVISIKNEEQANELLKEIVNKKISIEKFELVKPTLHEIFIEKVGEQ